METDDAASSHMDDNPAMTKAIADVLWELLPKVGNHPDHRYFGEFGSKTKLGLRRSIERLVYENQKDKLTISIPKALEVFTEWHRDEITEEPEAQEYARRLIEELKKEAKA